MLQLFWYGASVWLCMFSCFRSIYVSLFLVICQVGRCIQLVSTFVGGFAIAFMKGWLLTLVMLSAIPLIVVAGGIMTLFISRMAVHEQNAYARAATIVEQTIGSIRTVGHFHMKIYLWILHLFFCILDHIGSLCVETT